MEGILPGAAGKTEHQGKTHYHARDRIGDQSKGLNASLTESRQTASGCDQGCSICDQGSKEGGKHRHSDGMQIDRAKLMICKYRLEMFQGKGRLIRPSLYQRHNKDNQKHGDHQKGQDCTAHAPAHIPRLVCLKLCIIDTVIANVITFQITQEQNTDDRG